MAKYCENVLESAKNTFQKQADGTKKTSITKTDYSSAFLFYPNRVHFTSLLVHWRKIRKPGANNFIKQNAY